MSASAAFYRKLVSFVFLEKSSPFFYVGSVAPALFQVPVGNFAILKDRGSLLGLGISFILHLSIFVFLIFSNRASISGISAHGPIQIALLNKNSSHKSSYRKDPPPIKDLQVNPLKTPTQQVSNQETALSQPSDPLSVSLAGPVAPGNTAANTETVFNQYLTLITQMINQKKTYPKSALLRRLEGRVLVSMRIRQNGEIDNVQLRESSGFVILDDEALRSIKALQTVPRLAGDQSELNLEVPIRFELKSR